MAKQAKGIVGSGTHLAGPYAPRQQEANWATIVLSRLRNAKILIAMRWMHSGIRRRSLIDVTQGPIFASCSAASLAAMHNQRSKTMMTQPIRTLNNLSSETSPAGGNDIAKFSLSFEERRLLDLRARYARAEVLANLFGDMILWLRRTFGRLTAGIRENNKLRAAETQLLRMTDRELADLGLCRADIAFAVREAQGFRQQFDVTDPVTSVNENWRRAA